MKDINKKGVKQNNTNESVVGEFRPNQETIDAIEEARKIAKEPGGWYSDFDDLWNEVCGT